jgi:hypothetical protein
MNNRALTLVFRAVVIALLFTGFAQMPIFARYYLADVPGFAWTADYYLNHVLHYVLAIVLLVFLGWRLPLVLRRPWPASGIVLGLCWDRSRADGPGPGHEESAGRLFFAKPGHVGGLGPSGARHPACLGAFHDQTVKSIRAQAWYREMIKSADSPWWRLSDNR